MPIQPVGADTVTGALPAVVEARLSATFATSTDAALDGGFGLNGTPTVRIPFSVTNNIDGPAAVAALTGNLVSTFICSNSEGDFSGAGGIDAGYWFGMNHFARVEAEGLVAALGSVMELAFVAGAGDVPLAIGLESGCNLFGPGADANIDIAIGFHAAAPRRLEGATGGSIGFAYSVKIDAPTIGNVNFSAYIEGTTRLTAGKLEVENAPIVNVGTSDLIISGGSGTSNGAYLSLEPNTNTGSAGLILSKAGSSFLVYETGGSIPFQVFKNGDVTISKTGGRVGFFGAGPASKPTGVTVDAAGIHAALVSLGLIAA